MMALVTESLKFARDVWHWWKPAGNRELWQRRKAAKRLRQEYEDAIWTGDWARADSVRIELERLRGRA